MSNKTPTTIRVNVENQLKGKNNNNFTYTILGVEVWITFAFLEGRPLRRSSFQLFFKVFLPCVWPLEAEHYSTIKKYSFDRNGQMCTWIISAEVFIIRHYTRFRYQSKTHKYFTHFTSRLGSRICSSCINIPNRVEFSDSKKAFSNSC